MSTLDYEVKDIKDMSRITLKADGSGAGTCLFSRFDCIDADMDVTRASFLPDRTRAPMLVGHEWKSIPVGSGVTRIERDAAYFDFELTPSHAGKELGEWLRHDLSSGEPRSEFSYGFTIKPGGSSRGLFEGKSVRFLHGLEDGGHGGVILEISYVLKGSGVSTSLIAMKGEQQYSYARRYADSGATFVPSDYFDTGIRK